MTDTELLDFLQAHPEIEIRQDSDPESTAHPWVALRSNKSMNDREWTIIAVGHNLRDVILGCMAVYDEL